MALLSEVVVRRAVGKAGDYARWGSTQPIVPSPRR